MTKMSYICSVMTIAQHITAFAAGKEDGFLKSELSNALASFGVPSSSMDKTLQRLVRSGRLEVLERGKYRIRGGFKQHFMIQPVEDNKALYRQLKGEFPLLDISVWDVSAIMPLMHHIPNVKMTLVYVEKDGFRDVADTLESMTEQLVFRSPSRNELVHLAFGRDFIVIRPLISQSPLTETDGVYVPKIEKVLVDILCDEEFYYLQGSETFYIYETAMSDYTINTKTLLRYAHRRGVAEKIERIIKTNNHDTSGE